MTIKINASRALELLEEVVAESGDEFVYEGIGEDSTCLYQVDGVPSCAVGRALAKAGVPIDTLQVLDRGSHTGSLTISSVPAQLILRDAGIAMTDEATNVLHWFQVRQDAAARYGESYDAVKALHEESDND